MSTTIYDVADLTNIQRVGSLGNIVDSGTGVNADMSGSDSATANGTSDTGITAFCSAADYEITADVDHSHPINPIPSSAVITNVIIRFTAEVLAACDADCTAGGGGPADLASLILISILPQDTPDSWSTVAAVDVNTNNTAHVLANNSDSVSNSYPLTGTLVSVTYDFTTNPNGDFPLGYMDYASFIAFFASIALKFNITVEGVANNGATILAAGTAHSSLTITTTQWEMEVTWQQSIFSSWITVNPTTVDVTDPVIQIDVLEHPTDPSYPDVLTPGFIDQLFFNSPDSPCNVTIADPVVDYWWIEATDGSNNLIHRIQIRIVMCALVLNENVTLYASIKDAVIPSGTPPNVTEFSGVVSLGILTINYADLSGIYSLDDSVHSDTLYDRSDTAAITTLSVGIPTPFFVSAFIGDDDSNISHYTGTRMRVTGAGTLKQIFQSLDALNSYQLPNLTLLGANNVSPFIIANYIDQNSALRVFMETAVDDYFNVSSVVIFVAPLFTDYPQ